MFGRKKRSLSDFDSEIQAHIDFEAEELREDGLSEEEAQTPAAVMNSSANMAIGEPSYVN